MGSGTESAQAPPVDSHATLKELGSGNQRFVEGKLSKCQADSDLVQKLVAGQAPHSIILGCCDSRCPPELVFDQGLGDLFTIRVAGNVVNQHIYGSILYAVQHLHSRLVVVLGHTKCGAVKAAVDHICQPHPEPLTDLDPVGSLLQSIEPTVKQCVSDRDADNDGELDAAFLKEVSMRNATYSAKAVRDKLRTHLPLELHPEVTVVSAIYNLESGKVDFLEVLELK